MIKPGNLYFYDDDGVCKNTWIVLEKNGPDWKILCIGSNTGAKGTMFIVRPSCLKRGYKLLVEAK